MNHELTFIQNELKKELDELRYQHTLGVMYTASAMAMCHGADLAQALTAGLLHDCAKCIPADEKIRMCKEYEIPVTDIEYANPGLLHWCLFGRRKIRNLGSGDSGCDTLSYHRETGDDSDG